MVIVSISPVRVILYDLSGAGAGPLMTFPEMVYTEL